MESQLDTSLDLNTLAVAFMHFCRDLPEQVGWTEPTYRTAAWYNGRERGWSLTVKANLMDREPLMLCFSEHRNADILRIDRLFPASYDAMNPPQVEGDISFMDTWEFRLFAEGRNWLVSYVTEWLELRSRGGL